ncbi:MAG: EamA family transporter [Nitrospinae bacterium]|nr:EamA family transporter [Nitrospinota bacterium]
MVEWISSWGSPEFLALATSFSYSITLITVRRAMTTGSPLMSIIVLNSLVSIVGLTTALVLGTLASTNMRALGWFALTGVAGHGTGSLIFFSAIERLGVNRATAVHSSAPLWGVVFAIIILGEQPGVYVLMGTLGIVGGVFLLSWPERKRAGGGSPNWSRKDYLLPLFSSLCYAMVPVFAKLGLAEQQAPYLGFGVAFGSGLLLMLAARRMTPGGGVIRGNAQTVKALLVGLPFNIIAAFLMWTAFVAGMVSSVLPLSRMTPLWVILFSFLFLGKIERVAARTVLAACLVVSGGVMITLFG